MTKAEVKLWIKNTKHERQLHDPGKGAFFPLRERGSGKK